MASEILAGGEKTSFTHVPYKGMSHALNDLAGGRVDFVIGSFASTASLLKGGKLRVLAVTSPERSQFYPALPTIGEGQPGYSVELWWGVLAPAGTPAPLGRQAERRDPRHRQRPEDARHVRRRKRGAGCADRAAIH